MKTSQKILTITLSIVAIGFLTSCGTKKSGGSDATITNAVLTGTTDKPLASCNRSTDANMTYNMSVVTDGTGAINGNWIKIKFSYLSSALTQTGYTLKFYKWRVMANAVQLDSTPLSFNSYVLSSGQSNGSLVTSVYATSVNLQTGFYVQLNDDAKYPYQVLKVVAYKSDGTVAAQSDALIPQFLASPEDYKLNADGTARATNLQSLHPLRGQDVSNWSPAQLEQTFDQYCF